MYPNLDTKSISGGYGPPPPGYGPPPSPYGPSNGNNQSGGEKDSFGGLFNNIPWSGLVAAGSMAAMEYANVCIAICVITIVFKTKKKKNNIY